MLPLIIFARSPTCKAIAISPTSGRRSGLFTAISYVAGLSRLSSVHAHLPLDGTPRSLITDHCADYLDNQTALCSLATHATISASLHLPLSVAHFTLSLGPVKCASRHMNTQPSSGASENQSINSSRCSGEFTSWPPQRRPSSRRRAWRGYRRGEPPSGRCGGWQRP